MDVILPAGILAGVALAVLVVFLVLRFLVEGAGRLLRRRREPLLADRLAKHLAEVEAPTTLGERLDRRFERVVGRSSLGLRGAQGATAMLLVGVAAGVAVYLWREQEMLAAGAGLAAGVLLLGVFWLLHRRWQRRVQEQLPDTLHLLARSLRAGLTVDQSLGLIGTQGQQPLAGEFRRCSEHLKLGMTVPAALDMTGRRIDLPDFDLLVSLVALHRDTGGNLALLVDRLAATVRSRNHFRGQAAAVTALGRLTGFVLAIAPPVMVGLYGIIYPDYLTRLTATPQGLTALATALTLEVVGVLWLTWLLRIEY
jgi:tight adherence protein B